MRKKILALLIALIICVNCVYEGYTDIYASYNTTTQVIVEDGVEYTIKTTKVGDLTKSVIEYGDKQIATEVEDNILTATEYKYTGKNIFGKSKYEITRCDEINVDKVARSSEKVKAQYSWNSKTYTPADWGSRYWYQYGTSSYNNPYLQIGCKASYRLKYYKLSASKKNDCKQLTNEIKSCNKNYNLGSKGMNSSTLAIIVGTIIFDCVTVEIPVGVIVTAIVAIVGGYAGSVKLLVSSYYNYLNVRDDYTIVKTYGKKL